MFKFILKLLYRVPFLRLFLENFLTADEKRLHLRNSIEKLSDVQFSISSPQIRNHKFYLKDISLGGLAFVLDSNEQTSIFSPGSHFIGSLNFKNDTFEGKFRIAYTRNGISGCQVLSKKVDYKKFVTEKMADILVKSRELN